ncbi:MAG TPA: VWA domain-containing protein, partial [Pyrinomonadaceae bacterium]|nr:VWA domain-containing protein [Pyrinomonadaceae bacterium]
MHHVNCFPKNRGTRLCFNLLLASAVFLGALPVQAQEKKPPGSGDDDVIRVTSNLVNLDVMVKDKKGKAITDLKAEDFVLSENGVRQNIEFFDSTLAGRKDPARPAIDTVTTGTREPNSLPRNIISLVLDAQSTEGANLKHVRDGMTKYIRERITDSDSVALFAISGGLQLLQPFTQDKAKLVSAVERADGVSTGSKTSELRSINESMASIRDQLAGAPSGEITTPAGGSAAAQAMISRRVLEQYVQLRSALSSQQTRPVLAGLAAICEGLRSIPGKKTLVLFSQGFVAPQSLDWQVQSTIDIANRANVSIYIIDSGGLTGGTPQSGALVPGGALLGISAATSQESRIRAGAGESVFDVSRQEGLNRQQDLLYRISGDTGGQFIKNTNDIAAGLDRIDEEIRSRYTLAYRSTDPKFDGSFRKLKIEVRRPDAKVMARPGYYAIPPSQVVPMSPDDQKLMASFESASAHPTLPLSLQLNSFRGQPGYYIVPLSFEIPPAAVEFGKKGDKQLLQLDVLGLVRAEGDAKVLSRLGGNFAVELTASQYQSILNDKIFYRQDMELEAGAYTIDLVVKDRLSGKVAAKRQSLTLPATDSEFSATEAVLSRHAEPLPQSASGAVDVLTTGNVQIRPSPSREFQTSDNLIIFFKLYNASLGADNAKPLVRVVVTLMKDGKPA